MATVKILPTSYTRESNQLYVSNGSNLYTDTSSDTYARITHTKESSVFDFFVHGFETNKIPEGARVTNYSVKIKINSARSGITPSTGIFLCYSTSSPVWNSSSSSSYSAFSDTGILKSNKIPSSPDIYTFPTDSISWSTLNQYIQDGSFGICVPVVSDDFYVGGGVDIYGAEIEVTYDPPKKYVSDTKLQYFWNKLKAYFSTLLSSSTANWNETDSTALSYIQNKPSIKAGNGENSVLIGQIEQDTNAKSWSISFDYPRQTSDTITFTSTDDLSTLTDSVAQWYFGYINFTRTSIESGSTPEEKRRYFGVTAIDVVNYTLTITPALEVSEDYTYAFISAKLFYKTKYADGDYSTVEGKFTMAGDIGHAEGQSSRAVGYSSHAEGIGLASGRWSHAEGDLAIASAIGSHAEGNGTAASNDYSHAEGTNTIASGKYSHAENQRTTASGQASHAEGYYTTASGPIAHAEGYRTTVSNSYAHAEGHSTIASGTVSHAEGYRTDAKGQASHTEGAGTYASGNYAHAEGIDTLASGIGAHAEGHYSIASGLDSHVEGYYDHTNPIYLSGEANATTYTWTDSNSVIPTLYQYEHLILEGGAYLSAHLIANFERRKVSEDYIKVTNLDISNQTITVASTLSSASAITNKAYYFFFSSIAEGDISHAENFLTMAKGIASHSEGFRTIAKGEYSHAQGGGTIASKNGQFALGTYNIEDNSVTAVHPGGFVDAGQYAVIVGNGYADTTNKEVIRSNAHTLDWQGNGWYAGKLTVGTGPTASMDVATKQYVDNHSTPVTASSITSALGYTPANPSSIPTNVSQLTNDSGYITTGEAQTEAAEIFAIKIAKPIFIATDSMSKSVIQNAFDVDAPIIVPSDITSISVLINRLNPRTWFVWLNGTEVEFARLGVSLNSTNNAVTMYLRGRTSIAKGVMGVDSNWTVTSDNDSINALIQAALANYGDGDTATYGLGAWEGGSY